VSKTVIKMSMCVTLEFWVIGRGLGKEKLKSPCEVILAVSKYVK
jgi:hypothetical protein